MLVREIEFAVDGYLSVNGFYLSVHTGPYNDFVGMFLNAGQVAFFKPFDEMDAEHAIAFMDKVRAELPKLFKFSVDIM